MNKTFTNLNYSTDTYGVGRVQINIDVVNLKLEDYAYFKSCVEKIGKKFNSIVKENDNKK